MGLKKAHADYAPSSSDRWCGCVGSTQLIRKVHPNGVPDTQSHATASGTRIHEEAEAWLRGEKVKRERPLTYKLKGEVHEIPYSEWHPHVQGYTSKIREIAEELEFFAGEKATIVVEGKVKVVDPHCWGSVDCYIYAGNELYVIDLKTGRGHIVAAEQNTQFMTYAAGICIEHKWKFDEIHLCRYQAPDENHPFDEWSVSKVELQNWVTNLRSVIKESEAGKGELTAGAHCLWCPAKAACPVQNKQALSVFDDEEAATTMPVENLSMDKLSFLLKHANVIKDYLSAVEAYALGFALDNPNAVEGYKVVEGRSNRKWNRSEPDIIAALSFEEIDHTQLYEPPKLKSFTQVEKVIGKKRFAELDLIEKPPGKPTLVPVSDKRNTLAAISMSAFDDAESQI